MCVCVHVAVNMHRQWALADFVSTSSSFCFELSCLMAVVAAQVDLDALLLPVAYSISCRHT